MPRQNDNTELLRRLNSIELVLPQTGTIFDQTTAGSTARGSATIAVPATTNATNGDPLFLIGPNGTEINRIIGAPNVAMPLTYKTEFVHPAGTRVLEGQILSLGRIEQNGFSLSPSQQETLIEAADSDTAIQTIRGTLELSWTFGTLGFNTLNLLNAMGYESNEQGTGVVADPWQASIGGVGQSVIGIAAIRLNMSRFDSKNVMIDLTNVSLVPTGTIQMGAKNSPAVTGWSGKCSQIITRIWQ